MNWRADLPVLVPGCHAMGMIGVIRSLGKAGYPVHCCAPDSSALGLSSKYAINAVVCPRPEDAEFTPWIREYVRDNDIKAILPGGGLGLDSHPVGREFAELFPTSKDVGVLRRGRSKYDLFERLSTGAGGCPLNLPPFLLYDADNDPPADDALAGLGLPLFLKVDSVHARAGGDSDVHRAGTVADARVLLSKLRKEYGKILIQGYSPGRGVGAFFVMWDGEIRAASMHRRLHEVPHRGGASSFRQSWWHDRIIADAEEKLRRMDWQGVAMVEYRWNEVDDSFQLMEMNLRFWGSLHLALYAGVDFPTILLDCFHGRPPAPVLKGRLGVRCRNTFPYEVQYVWSILKDPGTSWRQRLWAMLEFFLLGLDPRVKSDLWFPMDRGLYWLRLGRFLGVAK